MYNSKKLIVCTALKLERQLNSIRVCALCCALGQAAQCRVQWLLSSCVKVALKCACLQAPTTLQYTQCSHQQLGLCAMPAFSYFLLHRVYFSLLLLPTIFLSNSPTISLFLSLLFSFFAKKRSLKQHFVCLVKQNKSSKIENNQLKNPQATNQFQAPNNALFLPKIRATKGTGRKV